MSEEIKPPSLYRCAICMDTQDERAHYIRLECTHEYHEKCLLTAFNLTNNKGWCPFCGKKVSKSYPFIYYVNEFFLILSYFILLILICIPIIASCITIIHITRPIQEINQFASVIISGSMLVSMLLHTGISFLIFDLSLLVTWFWHGGLRLRYLFSFIDIGKLTNSYFFLMDLRKRYPDIAANETCSLFTIVQETESIYSFLYVAMPLVKLASYFMYRFKVSIKPQLKDVIRLEN